MSALDCSRNLKLPVTLFGEHRRLPRSKKPARGNQNAREASIQTAWRYEAGIATAR